MLKSEIYHPFPDYEKSLLFCFKTDDNSVFDLHHPIGIKPLNKLRVDFSHLNEHKFRLNFRDTIDPLCLCNTETETTSHSTSTPAHLFALGTSLPFTISCVALCFLNKERNSLTASAILTTLFIKSS